jgi:Tfp pilus assembly protein PilZ
MTTARTARESLARALNALQADANAPPQLVELAAPIAQAMGALMNIERTQQLAPHADVALTNVRTALQALQQQPSTHPSVGQAMEAVASSLGGIHNLWRLAQPEAAPAPAPAVAHVQPPPAYAAPAAAAEPPAQAAPAHQPPRAPAPHAAQAAPTPQAAAAAPKAGGDGQVVNADLGTHSPTNFYKGLSGNDIIDHGGLFVSTYMVPKIGTAVRLKVSLPGGYEFEANAVVAWSREASDASADGAPPGFGAKFTQITPEARQLIYRYVRNREPLFHDDL